jgi:hypothetical protein
MYNLTMLPPEATQKTGDDSSSIQVTYQYALATDIESNWESPAADCPVNSSYKVSVTQLNVSCSFGGENK